LARWSAAPEDFFARRLIETSICRGYISARLGKA
jgi:hypothetical protein